jgi:predicted ATP-grasp superfamily ATP-dependent carboligase
MHTGQGKPGAVILGSDFKALASIRSLGRRGIPIVLVDGQPRAAWYSRYVRRRLLWRGPLWGEDLAASLLDLAKRLDLDGWMLFAMQDDAIELVSRNHDALATVYRPSTPPWDTLQPVHDKRLLYRLAKERNVACPATWVPSCAKELEGLGIRFPAIVKPAISVDFQREFGRKALLARNGGELRQHFRAAERISSPCSIMVQELIPGDGRQQFSVAAFAVDGELTSIMTAQRRRQYPSDFGLSSSFVRAVDQPDLIPLARQLLRGTGISGMVEVEFKYDPRTETPLLLDVNVRPWAWIGLSIASGLDFPFMQYAWALGQSQQHCSPAYGLSWRRAITDFGSGLQEIVGRSSSVPGYVRTVRTATVPSVFDVRDPLPTPGDLLATVRRALHQRSPLRQQPAGQSPDCAFSGLGEAPCRGTVRGFTCACSL